MFYILCNLISFSAVSGQVMIIDHTCTDISVIPSQYIDSVKKMWADIPGQSHSSGYRIGCRLLEQQNPVFNSLIREFGTPDPYVDTALRISPVIWRDIDHESGWRTDCGEEDWFTSALARERIKAHLTYAHTNNLNIAAMGFGWCWDMTGTNAPGGTVDPVYQVHWGGVTVGSTDGDKIWGLDAGDSVLTGNRVCMDTYLKATLEYMLHCKNNSYPTWVFFTTGPVEGDGNKGERGYQHHLKHEHIRNFVKSLDKGILFDYADILCWNDSGEEGKTTWTDYGGTPRTFQCMHDDNMQDLDGSYDEDGDHIGQVGTLRLAKALWRMLARIAGWNDNQLISYNDIFTNLDISFYPNPFSEILSVSFILPGRSACDIEMMDILGNTIKEFHQGILPEGVHKVTLNTHDIPAGVYLCSITVNAGNEIYKLIKTK
ncbi:MAG: T9SS type A sorting domain-containing protein [Bacteroidales bacterium]|nr:T9SS type A sorting domain-containing protein [Bacteroidales bacterium]